MTGFAILGVIAAVIGAILVATGIRHQREQRPRFVAMLIGGMMLTAFGLVIAGFAIAYTHSKPLDLTTANAR